MREIGVLEAKTHFSALLDAVEREGEKVLITRHGRVVAQLSPAPAAAKTRPARSVSGEALLARFRALRAQIAEERPQTSVLSWDELKDDMRR